MEITLVDRRNFHLFQPLSYQVATGALSPGEVAYPLRAVFMRNRNVRVLLAEVDRFDLERREVVLGSVGGLPAPEPVPYDTLIVAGGSHCSYFGQDDWNAQPAEPLVHQLRHSQPRRPAHYESRPAVRRRIPNH